MAGIPGMPMSPGAGPAAGKGFRFDQLVPPTTVEPNNVDELLSEQNSTADFESSTAQFLDARTKARLLRAPQDTKEVWHVTVPTLPGFVFPDGQNIFAPTRPKAIIVSRLRPSPLILACAACPVTIVENVPPTGATVLDHIVSCILRPRFGGGAASANGSSGGGSGSSSAAGAAAAAGGKASDETDDEDDDAAPKSSSSSASSSSSSSLGPHRPGIITFDSQSLAYVCAGSIRAAGIKAVLVANPPSLRRFILSFAQALSARNVLRVHQLNLSPGVLDTTDCTPSMFRALCKVSRAFALANPWRTIPDRQTFRIRMEEAGTGPARHEPLVVWACVMGHGVYRARQQAMQMGRSPEGIRYQRSVSVFYKRYDAEMRLLKQAASPLQPVPPPPPPAAGNPLDMVCAVCGKGKKDGVVPSRCTNCREAYYCSRDCQASGLAEHKAFCAANKIGETPDRPIPGRQPGYGAVREGSCLFHFAFEMPLTDLAAMERMGEQPAGLAEYPFPITFRKGMMSRPYAMELQWLIRAMSAIIAFWRARPDRVEDLRPMLEEQTVSLVAETNSLAKPTPDGVPYAPIRPNVKDTPEQMQAIKEQKITPEMHISEWMRDTPWYEIFRDLPLAHVRTDPILSEKESENLHKETQKMMAGTTEPAAFKPGVFVPTKWWGSGPTMIGTVGDDEDEDDEEEDEGEGGKATSPKLEEPPEGDAGTRGGGGTSSAAGGRGGGGNSSSSSAAKEPHDELPLAGASGLSQRAGAAGGAGAASSSAAGGGGGGGGGEGKKEK